MNQLERIKENVEWRNENIQTESYATHMAFDSIEQIIDSEETKINSMILDNITGDEKFKILCRAKNIDIDEVTQNIISTIESSNIEDKDVYIGKSEVWDECYTYVITEYSELFIDYCDTLLLNREEAIEFFKEDIDDEEEVEELWTELDKEEKDFIKLALECKAHTIKTEMM